MDSIVKYLLICCLLSSCGDIIEKNISQKEVFLGAPSDGVVIYEDSVSFWWELLDGARSYEFILVSPNFEAAEKIVVDSLTSDNFLTFPLDPGDYQWEVRAINAGYSTDYFYRSFQVDTTASEDISSEDIEIVSPIDDALLSDTEVTFWWERLDGAEEYTLRIASPSFSNPSFGIDTTISKNILTIELDTGAYEWRVRGTNSSYSTSWFENSFGVLTSEDQDLSETAVTLLAPSDGLETTSHMVTFWWESLQYAESYELVIVSPSFDSIETLVENVSLEDLQYEVELDSGSYEWGVKAVNDISETEYSIRGLYISE